MIISQVSQYNEVFSWSSVGSNGVNLHGLSLEWSDAGYFVAGWDNMGQIHGVKLDIAGAAFGTVFDPGDAFHLGPVELTGLATLPSGQVAFGWATFDTTNPGQMAVDHVSFFGPDGASTNRDLHLGTLSTDYGLNSYVETVAVGGNRFLVSRVLVSSGASGTTQKVVAEVFDQNGTAVSGLFDLSETDVQNRTVIASTALAGGGAVIVWKETQWPTTTFVARIVDADGAPVGHAFTVGTVTDGFNLSLNDGTTEIVALANGGFAFGWSEQKLEPGTSGWMQFVAGATKITAFAADGSVTLPVTQLATMDATTGMSGIDLCELTNGGFAAIFGSNSGIAGSGEMSAQIFDFEGRAVGGVQPFNSGGAGLYGNKLGLSSTGLVVGMSVSLGGISTARYDFAAGGVQGTSAGETIYGKDRLQDVIEGAGGDDTIFGGARRDTAVYSGARATYTVTRNPDGSCTVRDDRVGSPDGADTLWSIETLAFADTSLVLVTPAARDFDGSGTSDVLLRNASGVTYLWTMNGTAVTAGAPTALQAGTNWKIEAVADFDGNDTSDILWVYSNAGDASDPLQDIYYMSFQNGAADAGGAVVQQLAGWSIVGVGDFTGDGKADVLYRSDSTNPIHTNQTFLQVMNGSTTDWNASGLTSDQVTDTRWSVVAVADFDGDGKADVLWRYDNAADASDVLNGALYEWKMDGTGVTSSGLLSQQASGGWQVAGTGDFDGNGTADILFRYENDANASDPLNGISYIYFMSGATVTSGAPTQWQVDTGWQVASIGDFDGNGKSDILWQQTSTGSTYAWLMDGTNVVGSGFTSDQAGVGWTTQNGVLVG